MVPTHFMVEKCLEVSLKMTITEDFEQMMYRLNGENHVVRASCPRERTLSGLTHGHYTRMRVNAIRFYIWRFQGKFA